ncbi:unnamed protein product [Prunus brigantina]
MWSLTLPPKVKIFAWFLIWKRLQFAVNIWRCTYFFLHYVPQNVDGFEWLDSLPHTKVADGPNVLSKALLLCWQIWEARNNCTCKDIDPHPVRVLNVAGRIGLDYWKINSCPPQKSTGKDIQLLSSYCEEISFKHIFREANFTADAVASLGHSLTPSRLWDRGLPLSCTFPFYFDLVGPACPHDFRL